MTMIIIGLSDIAVFCFLLFSVLYCLFTEFVLGLPSLFYSVSMITMLLLYENTECMPSSVLCILYHSYLVSCPVFIFSKVSFYKFSI